jgi:hypothetical protein
MPEPVRQTAKTLGTVRWSELTALMQDFLQKNLAQWLSHDLKGAE